MSLPHFPIFLGCPAKFVIVPQNDQNAIMGVKMDQAATGLVELKKSLRQYEWVEHDPGGPRFCQCCKALETDGHTVDCEHDAILQHYRREFLRSGTVADHPVVGPPTKFTVADPNGSAVGPDRTSAGTKAGKDSAVTGNRNLGCNVGLTAQSKTTLTGFGFVGIRGSGIDRPEQNGTSFAVSAGSDAITDVRLR